MPFAAIALSPISSGAFIPSPVERQASSAGRSALFLSPSYPDLVDWARQAGAIRAAEAMALLAQAARQPAQAGLVLRRAIDLRESLYRIFKAGLEQQKPDPADLRLLNEEVSQSMNHRHLAPHGRGYRWDWSNEPKLERVLWPVARSAAELLTSEPLLPLVGQCCSEHCDWLFVDLSKNHSRRWCAMRDCGTLAKVRRFRARHRTDAY